MKITKTQLRRIIKEELSNTRVLENKSKGRENIASLKKRQEAVDRIITDIMNTARVYFSGLSSEEEHAAGEKLSNVHDALWDLFDLGIDGAELDERQKRNESREDHIAGIKKRLDKSRRRAGYELEPGGIGQTDRAQRQFYREDPDIGFDNHSNDPGDDSPESGAYWDSVDKAEQDWINDRAKNALLPDEKRERADLLNKIARLEKELARLKSA